MITYAHGCQENHEPGIACEHGPRCADCEPDGGCVSAFSWCPVCLAAFALGVDDCPRCDGAETADLLKKAREEAAAERTRELAVLIRFAPTIDTACDLIRRKYPDAFAPKEPPLG